jgi:high affinity sulfate transporter 1
MGSGTTDRLGDWLPGVRVARTYHGAWLRADVPAGLVLTSLLVPAGMGYAQAAGLPPVYGLYATVVPLLVYAVAGPSRLLIFGPDSSLAPLIAASVLPLAGADPARAATLAAALAVFSGVMCVAAGLARVGYITDLLSLPVRYGYLNGIALLIVVSQVAKICEIPLDSDDVIGGVRELVSGLRAGEANATSVAVGAGALLALLALRRWLPRLPAAILVVGASIALVALGGLDGLHVVGELPSGLPTFEVPHVNSGDLGALVAGAAGIAVVSIADTSVLSRTMAVREHRSVDPNRELVATGLVHVSSGLFQGFPTSASSSRTPVAMDAGGRTQLTAVIGALSIVAILLWAPGVFRDLPTAALGAVVIVAAMRLVEIRGVARLARVSPAELVVSLVAFAGVAVFGVIVGIGIAVGVSLLAFIRRAWAPHTAELVRVDGLKGYHDVARHPEGRRVPGLALFRFDAPLFFANADSFKREVVTLSERPGVRWIVVTAEPVTDVDATGAEVLASVLEVLNRRGIVLAFAEMKGPVRDRLARSGLVDRIGRDRFYRTVGEAVKASVAATGSPWTDWEDQADVVTPSHPESASKGSRSSAAPSTDANSW